VLTSSPHSRHGFVAIILVETFPLRHDGRAGVGVAAAAAYGSTKVAVLAPSPGTGCVISAPAAPVTASPKVTTPGRAPAGADVDVVARVGAVPSARYGDGSGGTGQLWIAVTWGRSPALGLANPPPPIPTENTVLTASGAPGVACSAQAEAFPPCAEQPVILALTSRALPEIKMRA